jgi:hypothetical protein
MWLQIETLVSNKDFNDKKNNNANIKEHIKNRYHDFNNRSRRHNGLGD